MFVREINNNIVEYNLAQLSVDYPNTSFPFPLTTQALEEYGIFECEVEPYPAFNQVIEKVIPGPILKRNNLYKQTWIVTSKFTEYIEVDGTTHTVEDQIQAALTEDAKYRTSLVRDQLVKLVQLRLDNFAQTRNYDGILSLCTYALDPSSEFRTEAEYGISIRSATWSKFYSILEEVDNGIRPLPTSFADIEMELPALEWPSQQPE
jgi:hypothetical protein